MANEVVTIGCRLPMGYVLEVGVQTTVPDPVTKRPVTLYRKLDNYARFALKGTNTGMIQRAQNPEDQDFILPSRRNPPPFMNRNVPKALWDQWCKDHPGSYLIKQRLLFEVKGGGPDNEKAATLDAMSAGEAPFQPLDRTKPMRIGNDTVEKANFSE